MYKHAVAQKPGSGAKKAGSRTKEADAGKFSQQAGGTVPIQSYIGLISCNGKFRGPSLAREAGDLTLIGNFDLPFRHQSSSTSSNWSTRAQPSDASLK